MIVSNITSASVAKAVTKIWPVASVKQLQWSLHWPSKCLRLRFKLRRPWTNSNALGQKWIVSKLQIRYFCLDSCAGVGSVGSIIGQSGWKRLVSQATLMNRTLQMLAEGWGFVYKVREREDRVNDMIKFGRKTTKKSQGSFVMT